MVSRIGRRWTLHKNPARIRATVAIVIALALMTNWLLRPNGTVLERDEFQNLALAYNLATHGVFSLHKSVAGRADSIAPTRYREPFPPAVTALYLKALELVRGPFSLEYLRKGPGAQLVKSSNVIWGIVLCLSVYAALSVLTMSFPLAAMGALAAGLIMRMSWLMTEPAAQALLALVSFLLMMAVRSGRPVYWGLAGLSLGALILTKALFLYIGLVLAGCFGILLAWQSVNGRGTPRMAVGFTLFLAGLVALVGPWMARNAYYFGSAGITDRGGVVLLVRALQNQMTWAEYKGAIYAWAPGRKTRRGVGWALGYSAKDLAKGSSLQRLNRDLPEDLDAVQSGSPESATSYFAKARAKRVRLWRDLKQQGAPYPKIAGDAKLRSLALRLIREHPMEHISMFPLYLWRGAPLTTVVLCLAGVFALRRRRYDLIAYMLPTLGMVAFLALATHFISRYGEPAMPITLVLAIVLSQALYLRWRGTSGAPGGGAVGLPVAAQVNPSATAFRWPHWDGRS